MNFFKKSDHDVSHGGNHQEVLRLTARQLSLVVAGLMLLFFFMFIVGYFYGQKNAAEQFTYRVDQESLADQIYSSMCGLYDNKSENDAAEESEEAEKIESSENVQAPAVQPVEKKPEQVAPSKPSQVEAPVAAGSSKSSSYYAELAGFSTQQAAQKCAKRLENKGISVLVKERQSKTSKGAKVSWYQVVTRPYTDKEALRESVVAIKKIEHIKDVRILNA